MDNVRRPFTVSLIAPPDPRFTSYDTTIYAGSLADAHRVVQEISAGHNAQNHGFWSGWCYEIKGA